MNTSKKRSPQKKRGQAWETKRREAKKVENERRIGNAARDQGQDQGRQIGNMMTPRNPESGREIAKTKELQGQDHIVHHPLRKNQEDEVRRRRRQNLGGNVFGNLLNKL
mmetsp:Transcript_10399/g.15434  ORF Transcript_10399/g.15434 Transcript_10399/m.15434 type:complete len:109 (+) Transcript_10399:517-843(+)